MTQHMALLNCITDEKFHIGPPARPLNVHNPNPNPDPDPKFTLQMILQSLKDEVFILSSEVV